MFSKCFEFISYAKMRVFFSSALNSNSFLNEIRAQYLACEPGMFYSELKKNKAIYKTFASIIMNWNSGSCPLVNTISSSSSLHYCNHVCDSLSQAIIENKKFDIAYKGSFFEYIWFCYDHPVMGLSPRDFFTKFSNPSEVYTLLNYLENNSYCDLGEIWEEFDNYFKRNPTILEVLFKLLEKLVDKTELFVEALSTRNFNKFQNSIIQFYDANHTLALNTFVPVNKLKPMDFCNHIRYIDNFLNSVVRQLTGDRNVTFVVNGPLQVEHENYIDEYIIDNVDAKINVCSTGVDRGNLKYVEVSADSNFHSIVVFFPYNDSDGELVSSVSKHCNIMNPKYIYYPFLNGHMDNSFLNNHYCIAPTTSHVAEANDIYFSRKLITQLQSGYCDIYNINPFGIAHVSALNRNANIVVEVVPGEFAAILLPVIRPAGTKNSLDCILEIDGGLVDVIECPPAVSPRFVARCDRVKMSTDVMNTNFNPEWHLCTMRVTKAEQLDRSVYIVETIDFVTREVKVKAIDLVETFTNLLLLGFDVGGTFRPIDVLSCDNWHFTPCFENRLAFLNYKFSVFNQAWNFVANYPDPILTCKLYLDMHSGGFEGDFSYFTLSAINESDYDTCNQWNFVTNQYYRRFAREIFTVAIPPYSGFSTIIARKLIQKLKSVLLVDFKYYNFNFDDLLFDKHFIRHHMNQWLRVNLCRIKALEIYLDDDYFIDLHDKYGPMFIKELPWIHGLQAWNDWLMENRFPLVSAIEYRVDAVPGPSTPMELATRKICRFHFDDAIQLMIEADLMPIVVTDDDIIRSNNSELS